MEKTLISVGLADDHTAVRQAFRHVLSLYLDFNILFEADDGIDLLKKLGHELPDVLLLDLKMPHLTGLEALEKISDSYPHLPILILSAYSDELYVAQCLQYGVNGYLTKSMEIDEIAKAIRLAYRNEVYFSNLLHHSLLRGYLVNKNKKAGNLLPTFTDEEIQILRLLCREKNTDEIAAELHIGKRSVELKRDRMRQKANVKTVGGLLLHAWQRGLLDT
jgi:DNA-binding NarL/FixJ family response regulator